MKHVIEQNIEERMEMKGRLRRRRKQLLYDVKEKSILEIEGGSTRFILRLKWLWNRR
jgi:hypothetical protein